MRPRTSLVAGFFHARKEVHGLVLAPVTLDLDDTLTATEAADEYLVHPSTIHYWVRRGYLHASGVDVRDGRQVPVYTRGDVGLAERRARHGALRRRAVFGTRTT